MAQSFETQGTLYSIDQTRSYGQNGFTKREFVIKLTGEGEKAEYPNYVAFELLKDKCAVLDNFQLGAEVKVSFNLSGRLWAAPGKPEKCFVGLQAWRVEALSGHGQSNNYDAFVQSTPDYENNFDQDVPF